MYRSFPDKLHNVAHLQICTPFRSKGRLISRLAQKKKFRRKLMLRPAGRETMGPSMARKQGDIKLVATSGFAAVIWWRAIQQLQGLFAVSLCGPRSIYITCEQTIHSASLVRARRFVSLHSIFFSHSLPLVTHFFLPPALLITLYMSFDFPYISFHYRLLPIIFYVYF